MEHTTIAELEAELARRRARARELKQALQDERLTIAHIEGQLHILRQIRFVDPSAPELPIYEHGHDA